MKVKVVSVSDNDGRASFCFVDERGRVGTCRPSLKLLQTNPSFIVKPGDEVVLADFIPDHITKEVRRLDLTAEFIQKTDDRSHSCGAAAPE